MNRVKRYKLKLVAIGFSLGLSIGASLTVFLIN